MDINSKKLNFEAFFRNCFFTFYSLEHQNLSFETTFIILGSFFVALFLKKWPKRDLNLGEETKTKSISWTIRHLRVIQEHESVLKHKLVMYFTSVDHNINPK